MRGAVDDAGRRVRAPVVAGSFYPGSRDRLAADVDGLLAAARQERASLGTTALGIVTPHAGYRYSGPIAATAYAFLSTAARPAARIIILGPSHFVSLWGFAVTGQEAWATPLGEVAIDGAGREAIVAAGAQVDDDVHRSEHSIEVQLPFVQRCLPGLPVLPVAVGGGAPESTAEALAAVMTDEAVLVVSTDLSHYHDATRARRLDASTAAAIESLDPARIGPEDACGSDALRVAMAWARRCGFGIRRLDLRNSADTAGDPGRVVGYGAFAIEGHAAREAGGSR